MFPSDRALRPEGLHRSHGVAASGFRPLRTFPTAASRRSLDVSQFSVADHPLRPAIRLRLAGLYPNYLMERGLILWRQVKKSSLSTKKHFVVLFGISFCFRSYSEP